MREFKQVTAPKASATPTRRRRGPKEKIKANVPAPKKQGKGKPVAKRIDKVVKIGELTTIPKDDQANKRGRPRGNAMAAAALTDYTRMIGIELLVKSGKRSPIEVMFENMWWADEEGKRMLLQFQDMMEDAKKSGIDPEKLVDGFDLYKEGLRMMGIAQACAREAAPYVHPRLAQIDVSDQMNREEEITQIKRVLVRPNGRTTASD